MQFLMFAAGLLALVVGASLLVRGAASLAASFGISSLVVGLTVVAFGTSAPEMAVSIGAVLDGRADISVGNVVGSNIFNVLFILGISALIIPLTVDRQLIRRDVPVMLASSVLLLVLCLDGSLSFWDGALLFGLIIAYTALLIVDSRRQAARSAVAAEVDPDAEAASAEAADKGSWLDDTLLGQVCLIMVGLGGLVLGSEWLVESAVAFAKALGVSDLVIGLTIVAAGTSLPEVAASIAAALKGERDIAVGNVVGSNIFNILSCLGLSALVSGSGGLTIPAAVQAFDIWVMLAVALACVPVFFTGRAISRGEGAVFLGYYAIYTAYLVLAAQHSAALEMFALAVVDVAIPLTLLIFTILMFRADNRADIGMVSRRLLRKLRR